MSGAYLQFCVPKINAKISELKDDLINGFDSANEKMDQYYHFEL